MYIVSPTPSTQMTYAYHLFNLYILSELAFPGVAPLEEPPAAFDVHIRHGEIPPSLFCSSGYFQSAGSDALLKIKNVAQFWMHDGRDLTLSPEAQAAPSEILAFLMGPALAALLLQRNSLILHGNSIVLDDSCLIFAGRSGIGKSSLAYAFYELGYEVLADDVSVVFFDGETPMVSPGYPRIKLWKTMLDHYELVAANFEKVLPSLDKYQLPISRKTQVPAKKLKHFYALGVGDSPNLEITQLRGEKAFSALVQNSYRYSFLVEMGLKKPHFEACCKLTKFTNLFDFKRPSSGQPPRAMALKILETLALSPT